MAAYLIDTIACPVKVLHRWTAGTKPPVKPPVKDWCKDKKQRWFVAQFYFLPSQTVLKYFHKKDDWTTGCKPGTHINLAEVVSTRTLPPKEEEHRLEINLEDYSLMLVFDHRQSPETVCKLLKVALRTFHVKVERCPDQHRLSREYVASLEPDRICFHCTERKDDDVCWLFSQVKGFQYKSDFGHLIVETSSATTPAGGQYAFSGTRVLQLARKLRDYMSVEEERYRTFPSHRSPQFDLRGGSLRREREVSASHRQYEVPRPLAFHTTGHVNAGISYGHSISDPGMILDSRPFRRARLNTLPHLPYVHSTSPQGIDYRNPYYEIHPMAHRRHATPGIRGAASDDEESIYESINDYEYPTFGARYLDQRPPMPIPSERRTASDSSYDSHTSTSEEEGEVQRQVEEAMRKIELGESRVAEDSGYVPIGHLQQMRTATEREPAVTEDGYLKMYPHRELLSSQ